MSDALDRIRNRSRPKVTARDTSMTAPPADIQTYKVTEDPTEPAAPPAPKQEQAQVQTSTNADTSKSRHTDLKTSTGPETELQTKRSTFRMEAGLIDRLHAYCRHQNISREVFIEAMFEFMESHPDAMDQVMDRASEKHEYRQQLANRKRAEAMMEKFGGS